MTRAVVLAEVRLGLDDTPARDPVVVVALEDTPEKVAGDELGLTRIELALQDGRRRAPRSPCECGASGDG
jgi:hypothetical protein